MSSEASPRVGAASAVDLSDVAERQVESVREREHDRIARIASWLVVRTARIGIFQDRLCERMRLTNLVEGRL